MVKLSKVIACCYCNLNYNCSVPSGYPQNFLGVASTSHSATFTWDAPPPNEQNGIITEYFINITIADSGDIFQESTIVKTH